MDKRKPLKQATKAAPAANKPAATDAKRPVQSAPVSQNKNGKK